MTQLTQRSAAEVVRDSSFTSAEEGGEPVPEVNFFLSFDFSDEATQEIMSDPDFYEAVTRRMNDDRPGVPAHEVLERLRSRED